MFSSITQTSPTFTQGVTNDISPPGVFTKNTTEMNMGLNKVIAAFSLVKTNCDKACLGAFELKDSQIIDGKTQQRFDNCVKKCFVERLESHFPDNKEEITDFVLATAFEYNQKDVHSLSLNKVAFNQAPSNKVYFNNLENVAGLFDKYFV